MHKVHQDTKYGVKPRANIRLADDWVKCWNVASTWHLGLINQVFVPQSTVVCGYIANKVHRTQPALHDLAIWNSVFHGYD
jgi:hypothetical protein